jgi:uncharacterized protein HemX
VPPEEIQAAIELTAVRVVELQEQRENDAALEGQEPDPRLKGPIRDRPPLPRHDSRPDVVHLDEAAPREISGATRVPIAVAVSAVIMVATIAIAMGQQRSELQAVKSDAATALQKIESKATKETVEQHDARLRALEEDKAATAAKLQAIQDAVKDLKASDEKMDKKLDRILEHTAK